MTTGRRLTVAERDALERDGYLLVPSLLGESAVEQLRARLEALVAQEVAAGHANYGNPGTEEAGVVHAKLEPADPGFRPLCERRLLADAAAAVLGGPWHMSGLGLRAPLPGCGHQGWHPDFGIEHRSTSGPWRSLSAMWCITAFTADNGPLRVIPGSHRVAADPIDVLAPGCEMGPHPDEVKIVAAAGSVILFNGADLWHSGTFNYSTRPRLAVTASFAPGDSPVTVINGTFNGTVILMPIRGFIRLVPSALDALAPLPLRLVSGVRWPRERSCRPVGCRPPGRLC